MRLTLLSLATLAAAIPQPPAEVSSALSSLRANTAPGAAYTSVFNSLQSEGIIPSTVTAPWPSGTWGPGSGPWGPGGWHGGDHSGAWSSGWGPWGTGNWGPWSDYTTNPSWTTNAPWTQWWDGSACPGTDWPGWTEGPWSTAAPWTTWSGCTASTTSTGTYTTTVSGSQVVSTAYGIQVAAATGTAASASSGSSGAAMPARTAGPVLGAAAAVIGFAAVAL